MDTMTYCPAAVGTGYGFARPDHNARKCDGGHLLDGWHAVAQYHHQPPWFDEYNEYTERIKGSGQVLHMRLTSDAVKWRRFERIAAGFAIFELRLTGVVLTPGAKDGGVDFRSDTDSGAVKTGLIHEPLVRDSAARLLFSAKGFTTDAIRCARRCGKGLYIIHDYNQVEVCEPRR